LVEIARDWLQAKCGGLKLRTDFKKSFRMKKILFTFLFISMALKASSWNWYAAPNALITGDGSLQNPWPLFIALAQASAIKPGDTLYLRGGRYQGPGFISSLSGTSSNYVTVQSYANEWAVITDGAQGLLMTQLQATNPYATIMNVLIQGSELWPAGVTINVDAEQIQLVARLGSLTNWQVARGWNGTSATNHSIATPALIRADFISHRGSFVNFRDLEITSTVLTNRVVNAAQYLGCGLDLSSAGKGNKAIQLIIHNVGHPGIGFWSQGDGGEINGCLFWGNGIYDNNGVWTRGDGVYAQNQTGTVWLKNNISFRNFTLGLEGYGETGPVKGFRFDHNTCFMSPGTYAPLSIASGSTSMTNNCMWTNFVMGTIAAGYVSKTNADQNLVGNIIVNGGLHAKEFISGIYSNNMVFFPPTSGDVGLVRFEGQNTGNKTNLDFTWDNNTYYGFNTSLQWQHLWNFQTRDVRSVASDGSGNLKFENDGTNSWKDWSGFDAHSSYSTNWPTNYLNIQAFPLDYDTNRQHVVVINTTAQTNASLTLGGLGYKTGDRFEIRDAQNYFKVINSGVYDGGNVSLPLNLMEVAAISGSLVHYTNKHSNVDFPGLFNVFVLRRNITNGLPRPPSNLRVVQ
jgi:hypothetical protein